MKLRIKGNSLRLRLTKTEVERICNEVYIEERTHFSENDLTYTLEKVNTDKLSAEFNGNNITVFIPGKFVNGWFENDVTGFSNIDSADKRELQITVEKDFKCLDRTAEDQSDNYENPNQSC